MAGREEEEKREEFLRRSRAGTGVAFASWGRSAFRVLCPAVVLVATCAGTTRAEAGFPSFEESPPAAAASAAAAPGAPADAGAIPSSAEVDALVAEALTNNPELRVARQDTAAARARVLPAGALPDPMLSLTYVNDGVSPSLGAQQMSRLELMAQQAIPFPGKLGLRERVAKADADRSATGPERVALALEAAVRRGYATLLQTREDLRLVGEQIDAWREIEEVIRVRYSAGLGSQQDVLRAQSEKTRLLQQRRRDEAAEQGALVELRQLLYRPPDAPIPTARRLVPGEIPGRSGGRGVPEEGNRVDARAEGGRPREGAVQTPRGPRAPQPQARLRGLRGLHEPRVAAIDVVGWLRSFRPLVGRSEAASLIVEAESQFEAASATEASLRRQASALTEERLIRIRQLGDESRLDAEALLVQDRLAVDAALASYRTGSVPFVTVLEAISTNFTDRRAAIARLADILRADADLREFSLERTAAMPNRPPHRPWPPPECRENRR